MMIREKSERGNDTWNWITQRQMGKIQLANQTN